MYSDIIINILLIIAALAAFILGIFIFVKKKTDETAYSFSIACICVGFWSLGIAFFRMTNDLGVAYFWNQEFIFTVGIIPIAFVQFAHAFINRPLSLRKKIILYIPATFILYSVLTPNVMIKEIVIKDWGKESILGYAYPVYGLYITLYMGYAFLRLFHKFLKSQGLYRMRIKYVIYGTLPSTVLGSYFNLYLILLGNYRYIWVGPYCSFILVGVIAYAIYKHRLMDIRVAVTRAGIFAAVYALVLGIPFGVICWAKEWLQGFGYYGVLIPITLMAVLASLGPFIYSYLQRKAEEQLRKEEFKAHQALNNLSQNMMRFTHLQTLLNLIVHQIAKIMKVNFASVYIKDEESKYYRLKATWSINNTSPEQGEFSEDSSLAKDISLRRVPLVSEELKFGHTSKVSSHLKKLQLELQKAKAAVIIPAFRRDATFGFLILGERRDSRLFTQDDLNLLMLLANQSVLAIENAQFFEKEKIFLAEQSRRSALADMAPGVSHQFNNRLMAIVAAAEVQNALIDEEDLKKLDRKKARAIIERAREAFHSIMEEGLKGKDIARAILKKGKAKITYAEADLGPVIQSAIELLKLSRTRASLEGVAEPEIVLDVEKGLPQLMLSESLMQDIFYNLIDNARDAVVTKDHYMRENKIEPEGAPYKGKITITARAQNDKIIVTVVDNGIGIKEEARKSLFVPYFTTKASANKGTGMGLWTIRGFIENHKGTVIVESEYTKGTIFTVTFPMKAELDSIQS